MSLVGAVYGTLLVNAGKTFFSESFPDMWLFLMAGLFIGVTMAFPLGLAGVWEESVKPWLQRRIAGSGGAASRAQSTPVASASGPTDSANSEMPRPEGARAQSV
jgi:urea transport system permease protein